MKICKLCNGDGYVQSRNPRYIIIFNPHSILGIPVKYLDIQTQDIIPSWEVPIIDRLCPGCLGTGEEKC